MRGRALSAEASRESCRALVIVGLCLCVLVQMLGVPVTLLNPDAEADTMSSSVFEGFSIPPTLPQSALSPDSAPLFDVAPLLQVPLLASALFHPPLS